VAVFTLDPAGRVAAWSVTAAALFGRTADEVTGQDVCAVLLTAPGQRELVVAALAATAAQRTWSAALAVPAGSADIRVTLHCEPLAGPQPGALVIAQQLRPPGQDLLREAATRIGTTLDLPRTAREVADVAVPAFADAMALFVAEHLLGADEPSAPEPGATAVVRWLAARLADQATAVTDGLLRPGEALVFRGDSPSLRAMTTGSPVLFDRLDPDTAQRLARGPGARQVAAEYTSWLSVPLAARGTVLGCATFGRAATRPRFDADDIALAGELAARAAVCIDNARLYDRERRIAFALQQGLLPAEPRGPAGLAVVRRYLPVGASVVGGDWHDIVPLADGRAALIVGDAMGHGPEAAAVMVQLRTAAHTLAGLELPPEEVLRRLDRMAAGMPASPFATCICAVIDPPGRSAVLAKAGHPPPVLTYPDGATEVLDLPDGLPLGLAAGAFRPAQVPLPPGATLALYTDGLVESRTRPLERGLSALREALGTALARPASSLDSACETITQTLRQRGEDDITLVLARIRE
jgi:serine phosphatase RsbU (regulator of sigma subunit)